MPKRERYLWVCQNERPPDDPRGSCARAGGQAVHDALKVGIVKRGLRKRLRVCESSCLDLCWVGVSIAVQPDNAFYGGVTVEDVPDILDALERGELVTRLVVREDMFDDPGPPGRARASQPSVPSEPIDSGEDA